MPSEFKQKQSVVLMAAVAAAFPLSGHAAGAALVDFAVGDVKALAADGRSRPLAKGAEIGAGELIDTGSGRAQVRFSDGAQVSLQPQTQFRIDDYRFAGKADGGEKGFFSLLKGGLRTITGLIGRGNRENYKVTTAVATIGIRGTEYSVAYGNSINVSTGEGAVEVCNAAGCLILNSGETAFVKDSNSKPELADTKTELPPEPLAGLPQGFSFPENRNDGGAPSALFPLLPSGPGYSLAIAGQIGGFPQMYAFDGALTTMASFGGSGALASFVGDSCGDCPATITGGVTVGGLSDGIIGWGRWANGTFDDGAPSAMSDVHYVVGRPTPAADMSSLSIANLTGTYALMGFTYPTSSTGAAGTAPISGSLTANFGSGTVSGSLSVPLAANRYDTNWSGSISGASFDGFGGVSGAGCGGCGCSASINGFFAGANAARAGLVYKFTGTPDGSISGAAAFRQTSLR